MNAWIALFLLDIFVAGKRCIAVVEADTDETSLQMCDTRREYMQILKKRNIRMVNFKKMNAIMEYMYDDS